MVSTLASDAGNRSSSLCRITNNTLMIHNEKKLLQLGMPIGTASNKLKKDIMLHLLKLLGANVCHHCNKLIDTADELSVNHKIDWLDSSRPKELFFDLDNIAFSHLSCNVGAARKKRAGHGARRSYLAGCRCDECKESNNKFRREQRKRNKQ